MAKFDLKKMKMPESPSKDPMLEMDEMEMEEAPEAEGEEMPMEASSPLDEISDEELFAEFKKRGLKPQDMEAAPAEDEEIPFEEMPEESEDAEEYA